MKFRGRVIYTLVLETGNTQEGIRFEDMPACERDDLGWYMGHLVQDKTATNGARMKGRRLCVRNLDFSVTSQDLRDMFSRYGEVKHVEMSERRGSGFVVMSSQAEAERAKRALNLSHHKGRVLRVCEARLGPKRQSGE